MVRTLLLSFFIFFSAGIQANACIIDIYANAKQKPKVYYENNRAQGVLIDMMQYVGADIGCQFNYHFSTWARAYKSMLDGKGGAIGLSISQERKKLIDYSDIMYFDDILLVTHIDNAFTYSGIQDLAGKTLGAPRGASYGDEFERGIREKVFTVLRDNGDLALRLKRIAKGRLDIAVINPGIQPFNDFFENNPELLDLKAQLYVVPTPFFRDPNYLGFIKEDNQKEFLKKFNNSMKKARGKGIFQAIEAKYQNH
ncbi:substrate-binding periplasmic protein [Psychromonas ossibalaenae]|uniref:substrate-binding periplasmic protein n=1 Tax=Psychromonas ossibalaenae TaxID=444922 RepID=UPI00036BEA31|nr:transporter substrate-binding domain-containing protein [Psychromonas ossibalaenae]